MSATRADDPTRQRCLDGYDRGGKRSTLSRSFRCAGRVTQWHSAVLVRAFSADGRESPNKSANTRKMPKAVLFHRFVVDVVAQADGTLDPAPRAVWRWEPAREEGDLPERLAALANATEAAVKTAASRFGPLRLGAPALVVREPWVRANVARNAIEMLDELETARRWYAMGMPGASPPQSRAYIAAGTALGKLPPAIQTSIDRLLAGLPSSRDSEPSVATLILVFVTAFTAAWLVPPPANSPEVLAGMTRLERLLRALSGLEPFPALSAAGGSGRIVVELLTSIPEFLSWVKPPDAVKAPADRLREIATETLEDWRSTADRVGALAESIALVSALDARRLSAADVRRLRSLAADTAGWLPPSNLAASGIAERLKPLLRGRLENELHLAGLWPVRQGVTTGAYWRALANLWQRLTHEGVPRLCAVEGCNQSIGTRPNRVYCELHRAERQTGRVRAARARARLVGSKS